MLSPPTNCLSPRSSCVTAYAIPVGAVEFESVKPSRVKECKVKMSTPVNYSSYPYEIDDELPPVIRCPTEFGENNSSNSSWRATITASNNSLSGTDAEVRLESLLHQRTKETDLDSVFNFVNEEILSPRAAKEAALAQLAYNL